MDQGNLKELLKKHALRVTDCRLDVLSYFSSANHALSSRDLEEKLADYDRVTLFRTLNSFVEKGLLHRIPSETGAANYALCHDHCHPGDHRHDHVHFTCEECGNTECIESAKVPVIDIPGYQVKELNFLVTGTCINCNTTV
ncbi:MAG: transcriptional repressor [Cyclobacteriaceae bacterium]